MLRKGVEVLVHPNDSNCFLLVVNGEALFNSVFASNNLMYVALEPVSPLHDSTASIIHTEDSTALHHRRLGHLSNHYLKVMCKHKSVEGLPEDVRLLKDYDVCSLSKNTKIPHASTRPRALRHLENVHIDLSGIIRVKGLKNELYYALFCDDFSSFRHIYFMNSKSKEEVFDVFTSYLALAERQTCVKLKQFTLDRGGELLNDLLGTELWKRGIVLHLTAAHSPEENGVSERGNRTVSTKARSMILESGMALRFWVQACKAAVFLTNRTVTTALSGNRTPFEAWHFRRPSVDNLKVFGCLSYSLIRKEPRGSKFNAVSSPGILMGFDEDNYNYHIFDIASEKLVVTHHAMFNENVFPFRDKNLSSLSLITPPATIPGVSIEFFNDGSDDEHFEEINEDNPTNQSDSRSGTVPSLSPPSPKSSSTPTPETPAGDALPRRSGRTNGTVKVHCNCSVRGSRSILSHRQVGDVSAIQLRYG